MLWGQRRCTVILLSLKDAVNLANPPRETPELAACPLRFKEMPSLSFLASNFRVHRNIRQDFCFRMIPLLHKGGSHLGYSNSGVQLCHRATEHLCSRKRAEQAKGMNDGLVSWPFLLIRNCKSHWEMPLFALT